MSNRSLHAANFNVSVIGLSGNENTRGYQGVGKSCLCNRFVRPDEDSYYRNHIYMLSQSDYGGEVVNNVSWLYWGETSRINPENEQQNWIFRVIEQTEFIDDTAFTLLSHGSNDSYTKRCLNLKLKSPRKLMYICKDQLGMEDEYRKEYLPDGKINIDGFVLVFDVSAHNQVADRQWEFLREVLISMPKVKRRPFVIVTSKNDNRSEEMRSELDKFLSRREIRNIANNVHVIETSAEKGINVDCAFLALGSLIEKSRTKPRMIPYSEAERIHNENIERLQRSLREKLSLSVINHRTNWQEWSRRQDRNLQEFFAALGTDKVQTLFKEHVSDLEKIFMREKMQWCLQELPKALDDLVPNTQSVQNISIDSLIAQIMGHDRFERWFKQTAELNENGDSRIPLSLLNTEEARNILHEHTQKLMEAETRKERRKAFMSLLRRNKSVKAGKELCDVSLFFNGEDCFDGLSSTDRLEVYMRYQDELTSRSKQEFQELLLERADLFFKLAMPPVANGDSLSRSMTSSSSVTSPDELLMRDLCENMQSHGQYRNFDYLPKERQEMICSHLYHFRSIALSPPVLFPASADCSRPSSLCAAPTFECPASPCVQSRLVECLSGLPSFRTSPSAQSRRLYVVGQLPWSTGVASILRDPLSPFPNCRFDFEFHTPSHVIRPDIFVHEPGSRRPLSDNALILLVYRDAASITQLEECAVHIKQSSSGYNCIVLHLCDVTFHASEEVDILRLRGGQLAIQVKGYFAEMQLQPETRFRQHQSHLTSNHPSAYVESLQLWNCLDNALHAACQINPKITIILALMCGDLYPLDLVMKSVVNDRTRFAPWKQRLYVGDDREIILSSYFQLLQLRTGTLPSQIHGLILLFWTARKASLAAMKAVSDFCPLHWPKLYVGIGVNGREDCLQDGQQLAHDMDSPFIHIQPEHTDHRARFDDFLRFCMESKPVTEKLNRPLMGHRRTVNHPSTLPPPPPPNSASRLGNQVIRRKSSVGANGQRAPVGGLSSSRKSWHSSNSGQEDGFIYSEPNTAGGPGPFAAQRPEATVDTGERKKGLGTREVDEISRGRLEEDEYSNPYDYPPEPTIVHCQGREDCSNQQPTPLSTLNNNSQDIIYSDPIDINSYTAHHKLVQNRTCQGSETKANGSATVAQPFLDVENEYAEVEGYDPNRTQQIQHIVVPKRQSPSPPPPFPRTTSEADSHNPWQPRALLAQGGPPEYDEPPCDPESPPTCTRDRMVSGYLSHDESSAEAPERVRRRSGGLLTRHNSERRSHKESKKKTRSELTPSKSFGGGEKLESKKSLRLLQSGDRSGASSGASSGGAAASSSKWRMPFRSGGGSSSGSGRASSASRGQSNSPRVQPPPVPPHPEPFVVTCTDFIERHGGLQTQGIYRECGSRNVAENIRQRSKDGYFLDWLISFNVTPHDVATALKLYLRDFPEPVVPLSVKVLREIAGESSLDVRISRLRQAISTLPLLNQRLLAHLLFHFRKVTDYSDINDMTASNLAICWTPTLAIPKNADMTVLFTMKPIQDLLALLIEHADSIFQSTPC